MNFLEKTFLDWKVMLDPMAARKPPQLKVASDADAAITPPTMGTKESSTGILGVSPRKMLDSRTEKKGSMDCIHTIVFSRDSQVTVLRVLRGDLDTKSGSPSVVIHLHARAGVIFLWA